MFSWISYSKVNINFLDYKKDYIFVINYNYKEGIFFMEIQNELVMFMNIFIFVCLNYVREYLVYI